MRPDFEVGVRNGLIEDKHRIAMRDALWMYLWLLDRQTKDNKVLGGRPIRYHDVCTSYPTMSRRTYQLHLDRLRNTGYIETLRTPRGLVIEIVKSKKWKSDRQNIAHHKTKSDVPKVAHQKPSDVQQPAQRSANISTSNIRATKSDNSYSHTKERVSDDFCKVDLLDVASTDMLITNQTKPKALRKNSSNPDINGVVFAFEKACGVKLRKLTTQRNMAKHLIQHYGTDDVLSVIKALPLLKDERYAPQILDLQDLWEKWDKLGAFFSRKKRDQNNRVVVIGDDE